MAITFVSIDSSIPLRLSFIELFKFPTTVVVFFSLFQSPGTFIFMFVIYMNVTEWCAETEGFFFDRFGHLALQLMQFMLVYN